MINYVILYTPLKKRTPLSVAVGAVSGAIPPLIGWAASRGALGGEAWLLFAVLFLWQLPHFLSIAWLYREDYDRAGFRVFSGSAGLQAVAWTLVLVALTLVPGGWIYRAGAALLGTAFVAAALHFATAKTQRGARRLLLASIAYLPVLLLLLLARG